MKTHVIYISDTNKNNIVLGTNSFKETRGLLFDHFKFYFLNLKHFKNSKPAFLWINYFSDWSVFKQLIKRKKIEIAVINLDIETTFSLKEIGFIYLLKALEIPIIFESERSQETINTKRNYLKKIFLKMIANSHLILPDERMSSIYTTYFQPSNVHYIALQNHSIHHSNSSSKKNNFNLDLDTVEFYMFLEDMEQVKYILKTCHKLKNLQRKFKFIFTSKQLLTFLPQLNEQIRLAKLMEEVGYVTINNLNSGNYNRILIHQTQPQDNFFPQEVLNALFLGRVVIGDQKLVENGLVNPDTNGSVFDAKETDSLFNQMNYYVSNPDEIPTRGMESKNTYQSYFSKATNGKKLLNLMNNLITK